MFTTYVSYIDGYMLLFLSIPHASAVRSCGYVIKLFVMCCIDLITTFHVSISYIRCCELVFIGSLYLKLHGLISIDHFMYVADVFDVLHCEKHIILSFTLNGNRSEHSRN